MFWDDDGLEVSGLITELEASGCRSCIAAKWVIPAHPSCQLIAFFCEQYLEARRRADSDRFLRARAFNTALKQMSRPLGEPFAAAGQIPAWVAAAFDFYGRG
jgi:hypothetical protein